MFLCDKCLNEVNTFHNKKFSRYERPSSLGPNAERHKCQECKSPTIMWINISQMAFLTYKRNKTINEIIKNAEVAELVRPQDT